MLSNPDARGGLRSQLPELAPGAVLSAFKSAVRSKDQRKSGGELACRVPASRELRLAVGLCNHLPQGPETHSIRLQPLGKVLQSLQKRRSRFAGEEHLLQLRALSHTLASRCCVLYNSNNGLLGDALGDHDVQPGLQLGEAAHALLLRQVNLGVRSSKLQLRSAAGNHSP